MRQGLGTASRAIGDIDTAAKELSKAVEISNKYGLTEQEMESLSEQAATIIFSQGGLSKRYNFLTRQ